MYIEDGKALTFEFKDEEGVHLIPYRNIMTMTEEIGIYNYGKREYKEYYDGTRYIIRTVNREFFYLTKDLYDELKKRLVKVDLKGERINL